MPEILKKMLKEELSKNNHHHSPHGANDMKNTKINYLNKNLIYYGPHHCQKCDKDGKKETLIVRAEKNGKIFTFDFVHGSHYPNHIWKKYKHVCKK